MRKVFLDCGAHDGCSVRKFRSVVPDASEYDIYCFEQDSRRKLGLNKLGVNVCMRAVSDYDGEIKIYSNWSIINLRKSQPKKVECIDLSLWITNNLQKDDYIFLKMDVEGAEYSILDKMDADGTLGWVNELYVEIHSYKYGFDCKDDARLLNLGKKWGLDLWEWDAENNNPSPIHSSKYDVDRFVQMYRHWNKNNGRVKNIDIERAKQCLVENVK